MAEEIQHKTSKRPKNKLPGATPKVAGKIRHDLPEVVYYLSVELESNPISGKLHELLPVLGESRTDGEEMAIATRYVEYKQLAARAVEVFGSETEAGRWLSTQSPDFSGRTPLQDFIEAGPEHVLNTLGRIEHGVYF